MKHEVKVYPSKVNLPRKEQFAWKIAAVAIDLVAIDNDVAEMAINRVIVGRNSSTQPSRGNLSA